MGEESSIFHRLDCKKSKRENNTFVGPMAKTFLCEETEGVRDCYDKKTKMSYNTSSYVMYTFVFVFNFLRKEQEPCSTSIPVALQHRLKIDDMG